MNYISTRNGSQGSPAQLGFEDVMLAGLARDGGLYLPAEWPRFSLESDEDLARIPEALVDDALGRMRCEGDRCAALSGQVGKHTACTIYDIRPDVCRACEPGDEACLIARRHFGL